MGDKKEEEDWEFSLEEEKIEEVKKEAKEKPALKRAREKKSQKLQLDKSEKTSFRQGRKKENSKLQKSNEVTYNPANPIDRFQAFILDIIIPAGLAYFIPKKFPDIVFKAAPYIGLESADSAYIYDQAAPIIQITLFIVVYLLATVPPLSRGASLGLKIKKLRLNHIDGSTLTFGSCLVRQSVGLILNIGSVVGIILPFLNSSKRTFHDFLFKSICEKDD